MRQIHLRSRQQANKQIPEAQFELKKFNYLSSSVENLDNIDLTDIQAIQRSDNGARGVIFVETLQGTFVLKASGEVGVNIFVNKLSLELGIKTPQMSYISWFNNDIERIREQMLFASSADQVLHMKLSQQLKTAFIIIMEYIPSVSVAKLYGDEFYTILNEKRCKQIGAIVAMDIFLNNNDRYPMPLWNCEEGNIENLLLKINQDNSYEDFYAIDSLVILKAMGNNQFQQNTLNKYQDQVRKFFIQLKLEIQNDQITLFDQLKQFIHLNTNNRLTSQQITYIAQGLIEQAKIIGQFNPERINQLIDSIRIPYENDWCGTFNTNLDRIHIQFYQEIIEIFKTSTD
ncbi:hypothetical protein pb186bvf_006805 [Paramecium bursaria]